MSVALSVIFPCYNEEDNIPLILDSLHKAIRRDDIEIIMVNNGSTDNSAEILDRLTGQYAFASHITVDVNQGYGYGILAGLKEAKGRFLGWMHADMQTDPGDITKIMDMMERNNYRETLYIKGIRKNRKFIDNFFSLSMSCFETLYLRTFLWEINAQPNIFHRNFYEKWVDPPGDFSLDLYVYYLARQSNMKIERMHVLFRDRVHGHSSWNRSFSDRIKFIKRTINYSIHLKKRLKEAS